MRKNPERLPSWGLREAARHTVNPEVFANFMAASRAWHAAGAPSRWSVLGQDLNGGGANPRIRRLLDTIRDADSAIERDFRAHLTSGRLIAWGRRGSPVAELKPMPPSAWKALRIKSYRNSCVVEIAPGKTPIYDVRIYSIVEAPDAVDHLSNRTLAAAFHEAVFSDPQAAALRQRAKALGGSPFEVGVKPQLFQAIWPVAWGASDGWWHDSINGSAASNGASRSATRWANLILRRRFARLIGYLAAGDLVAEALSFEQQGRCVPSSTWAHKRICVDLTNGDLIECSSDDPATGESCLKRIYTDLRLRKGEAPSSVKVLHVKPPAPDDVRSSSPEPKRAPTKKALVAPEIRVAFREECAAWLATIMRASSQERTRPKLSFWLEAQKKWRGMSERTFNYAWDDAIIASGAHAWHAAGAPKKQHRKESSRPNRRAD